MNVLHPDLEDEIKKHLAVIMSTSRRAFADGDRPFTAQEKNVVRAELAAIDVVMGSVVEEVREYEAGLAVMRNRFRADAGSPA